MPTITIRGDERVLLCGQTGSGKTWLALHLLIPVKRLVVIDLKRTMDNDTWLLEPDTTRAMARLSAGETVRARVTDRERGLEYCEAAMTSGNCIVYIDEMYLMVPPGERIPEIVNRIWTQGRELQVGGWAATQRPTWVPLQIISEASWYFVFRLRLEDDRKRMAALMGEEVLRLIPDKHGFYAMGADWDRPIYYPRLKSEIAITRKAAQDVQT